MKGLELSKQYYDILGRAMIRDYFPQYAPRIAAGLVGEGSECFGYDDSFSRDHDWGPAFCLWLTDEDYDAIGADLQKAYDELPEYFQGIRRRRDQNLAMGRTGVMRISSFYYKFTKTVSGPDTLEQWMAVPESFLATATNGMVFEDPSGLFTKIRKKLLDFYPEDIRRKKLSVRCAVMGQAGQYNYARALQRGNYTSAAIFLADFLKAAGSAVYLLNRAYAPYEKWLHYGIDSLPILGDTKAQFDAIAQNHISDMKNVRLIEDICDEIRAELKQQKISEILSDFLWDHAFNIASRIQNPAIRKMDVLRDFV